MVDKSCIRTAKNSRTTPTRSPSEGAPSGVSYVFVGRHGIETVSGASRLLLDLSGQTVPCVPVRKFLGFGFWEVPGKQNLGNTRGQKGWVVPGKSRSKIFLGLLVL